MKEDVQKDKIILWRTRLIMVLMLLFAFAILYKLISLYFNGEKYEQLITEYTIKRFEVQPNRGNLYSDDGSLLATSITRYDIRFDTKVPKKEVFDKQVKALSDSLAKISGKHSASYYLQLLRKARKNKERYLLLARRVGYDQCARIKNFPILNLGAYKGGLIVESQTTREYPLGAIAQRVVGYDRINEKGKHLQVGLEGAFSKYLSGIKGEQLKQKIAKGEWKPISDSNEIEPQDGLDVISTININIQDIAHHALLKQLEEYQADHGCAVVMEVNTGEIKAISNLGKTKSGFYAEIFNYAIGEAYEPGSVFKTASLITAIEEAGIDTTYTVDTQNGKISFHGYDVRDSNRKGYGRINLSKAMQVSSNTAIVQAIHDLFSKNPKKFVNRLNKMNLNKKTGISIIGEATPKIPQPGQRDWSGIALEWMSYGYGVEMTPLQVLTFYNAIANNGIMVKPRMIKEVKQWNKTVEKFDSEIVNDNICSPKTTAIVKKVLENTVQYGTGKNLYSSDFSMAGKTGTTQKDYVKGRNNLNYISSFAGFFPADNPKYSCIVVIHNPDKNKGIYGADVSGPVFKSIAHKIFTNSLLIDTIEDVEYSSNETQRSYERYHEISEKYKTIVPNVVGMNAMDAISILENMGLTVITSGKGRVREQSISGGQRIGQNKTIRLTLS